MDLLVGPPTSTMDDDGEACSDDVSVVDGASIASDDDDVSLPSVVTDGIESADVPLLNGSSMTISSMDGSNVTDAMAILAVVADSPASSDGTEEAEALPEAIVQYFTLRDQWLNRNVHVDFEEAMRKPAGQGRENAVTALFMKGALTGNHSLRIQKQDIRDFAWAVGCAFERGLSQLLGDNVDLGRLFDWPGERRPMLTNATRDTTFQMHVDEYGLPNAIQIFMVWELHNSVQTLPQQCDPGRPAKLNRVLAYGSQFLTSMGKVLLKSALGNNQFHTGQFQLNDPPP